MDLIKKVSKTLGEVIVTINDENEAMEMVMQIIAELPAKQFLGWLTNGFQVLDDDVTFGDLLEDEEDYDEILGDALKIEDLFTEKQLAELMEKYGRKEEGEPE